MLDNFQLISQQITNEEGITYVSYGIADREGLYRVEDVSSREETVTALIDRFCQYELSPIHLKDAVEDWLVDG